MSRPRALSGFPELTPEQRIVEQQVLDRLREVFELYGFASVETRAVEPLDTLAKQGEIDKEVYAVQRVAAEPGSPAELGLHFDLTVPFARYVLEHAHQLAFPFRRYQIQKVWRGERPQEGRYREFTQADVDIVNPGTLPAHFDVELPLVTLAALERLHVDLGLPPVLMRVNNRLLAQGFYRGLGIEDTVAVLRQVDKLDKIGPDKVADAAGRRRRRHAGPGAGVRTAGRRSRARDASFVDAVRALGVTDPMLDEGLALLADVVRTAARDVPGPDRRRPQDRARPRLLHRHGLRDRARRATRARGSISSGGRYDSLASDGKTTYPGVGLSIGVTRLLVPLLGAGVLRATRSVPTAVVVAVTSEDQRPAANAVAARLRARGIPTEVAPEAAKFGRQIRYADRRGIPYVWFGAPAEADEVKDIRSGDQVPADAGDLGAAGRGPAPAGRPGG